MINFYSSREEPYGVFSNFARYPIMIDGHLYSTSEHYYQSQKFLDPATQERVRNTATPMVAATLGRDRSLCLRPDWEQVKDGVMMRALLAKFTQHSHLANILLSTDNEYLVEHTENDHYWADGGDGSGRNMLGVMLMAVRKYLRAVASANNQIL